MKTGDKVCCVKSHLAGVVKKGQIYTILNIMKNECCGVIVFDVGISNTGLYTICVCGSERIYNKHETAYWLNSNRFAPIVEDEFLSSDEIEKIVEERIDIEIPVEA